jgi:hypothetical protein
MKKSTIAILLIAAWSFCFAQKKGEIIGQPDSTPVHIKLNQTVKPLDIRVPIMNIIARHSDRNLLYKTKKGHSYMMSIAVLFNVEGKIDTVYFSNNMSSELKAIIRPNSELIQKFRNLGLTCPQYKDKLAMFLVIFKQEGDNVLEYDSQFLNGFNNLWPEFSPKDRSKPIILLKSYLSEFIIRI